MEGPELRGRRGALPGRSARYWHPSIVTNDQPVKTTPSDYGPDIFAEFVVDFFRRHADRPVFVYYPMVLPHRSWDFENDTDAWLPVPEVDAQGRRTGHRVPGSLQSNVEYIDTLVGRILRGLERLGLREDTIVFFTGDNGSSGWGKASVEQERGPRVPMIVNGPAHVIPQGPVDALVDFTDVLPTLCELAQAQLPADHELDGRSFAPILRGEISDTREWIFSYYADYRMLRDKRWLLAGDGRFFDCGDRRDEEGYVDVTDSDDPAVVAARRRFQEILRGLPGPTPEQQRELRFEVQGFGSPRKPNDE